MCYSNVSVELMKSTGNYGLEVALCDLMQADELGQIMPDYPDGYIVISAGGASTTEIELVLPESLARKDTTRAA